MPMGHISGTQDLNKRASKWSQKLFIYMNQVLLLNPS